MVAAPTICNMLTVMSRIVNTTKERPSRIYSHELTPLKPCSKFHPFSSVFLFSSFTTFVRAYVHFSHFPSSTQKD